MEPKKSLAAWMEEFERLETGRRSHRRWLMVRVDGKNFSRYSTALEKPFDRRFEDTMCAVAKGLLYELGGAVAYTQSDEVTVGIYLHHAHATLPYGGRYQKVASVAAAVATAVWNQEVGVGRMVPRQNGTMALFDGRAWSPPSLWETANVFVWRQRDAVRNSVSMAASARFSHRALMGKTVEERRLMLVDIGVPWEMERMRSRMGIFLRRSEAVRTYTEEEVLRLPLKHTARRNPGVPICVMEETWVVQDLARLSRKEQLSFLTGRSYETLDTTLTGVGKEVITITEEPACSVEDGDGDTK